MKNIFKYILGFLIAFLIIIIIGGGSDFLAASTREILKTYLGIETSDYLASLFIVLIFISIAAILIPLILLFRTRFRKPVVFISFKHVHEEKAIDLETRLKVENFEVERLAFSPNYTHDEVVSQVLVKLQKADVVVTIPDAKNASFVDSELLAASALKIPIVLMQYQKQQAQPGTLLLGYPVFNYQSVQEKKFLPLFRFLLFVTRSSRDYLNQVIRIFRQMFDPITLGIFGLVVAAFLLIKFGFQLIKWILLDVLQWNIGHFILESDEMYHSLFIILILGFTVYSIVNAFYTIGVARQITVTGKESYQTFKDAFSYLKKDKEMLECIHQNNLEAKA
ncbi:MAG: hypothetical protein AB8F94_22560 [Saprospiraceae bacterium]